MTIHWGLDLGTSNTTICDDRGGTPRVLHLPGLSRLEPLTQTPVVPSCVCVVDSGGDQVLIGQEAVDYNWDGRAQGWAGGFKRELSRDPSQELVRIGDRRYTARDVARLFVDRLVDAVERATDQPVADLTVAV
ncbi:MAG: hypothetical protein KJO11_04625, partial [Gemmatimonadetes bacterium]|nr:hypothetical protein [Gemmatimonadota bacterium]